MHNCSGLSRIILQALKVRAGVLGEGKRALLFPARRSTKHCMPTIEEPCKMGFSVISTVRMRDLYCNFLSKMFLWCYFSSVHAFSY